MKHILNDMSEQEKNSIREQHTGGMKVMTENFNKLINSKLGDSKPLVNEGGDYDHFGLMVKPQLIKAGFKYIDEPVQAGMSSYGKGYFAYPDHNTGVNLFLKSDLNGPWKYVVYYDGNKGLKEFEMDSVKQAISYAISLKNKLYPSNSKLGDLKPLVKEEEDNDEQEFFKFEGKSMETIQKLISQLPKTTKFLAIKNCEGVDFSEMDLCNDFPGLVVVSLKNTPNNIKETNGDCVELFSEEDNLYYIDKNL